MYVCMMCLREKELERVDLETEGLAVRRLLQHLLQVWREVRRVLVG